MKKYKTRAAILRRIEKLNSIILKLNAETIELNKQQMVMSDKDQWYTEGYETFGRGKNQVTHFIGRINWKEDFIDEDNGDVVTINRSKPVKQDGEWL